MLRRVLTAIVLLACTLCLRAQEAANVYDSLRSWLQAVSTMPVDSINARCDALIAAAPDDEVRAKIAGVAFDYFMHSPVMGVEGVSVYIADNYFLNKRLRWPSEESFPNVYAFAEFNRLSLLGMQAQPLMAAEEAETYFGGDDDRQPSWWWLRSPNFDYDNFAGVVFSDGDLVSFINLPIKADGARILGFIRPYNIAHVNCHGEFLALCNVSRGR